MRTIISKKRNAGVRVCIDRVGVDFIVSGRCYCKNSLFPIVFYDVNELFYELKEILIKNVRNNDKYSYKRYEIDCSNIFESKVRFSSNCQIAEFETKFHRGDVETILINIIHNEDKSWLGFLSFIGKGDIIYFKSGCDLKNILINHAKGIMRVNTNIA